MFEDEASFGRINKPKYCWCRNKFRLCVPCHHIREYRYVFGAVEPLTGERIFLVMPNCDTDNMSVFFKELSKSYNDDMWDSSLWWSSMAQIKGFRNFGKHHNDTYTAIYTRNEPHWTNLETNKTDGVRQ